MDRVRLSVYLDVNFQARFWCDWRENNFAKMKNEEILVKNEKIK